MMLEVGKPFNPRAGGFFLQSLAAAMVQLRELSPGCRCYLVYLLDNVNRKTGRAYPKQSTAAAALGMNRQSISSYVRELANHGLISKGQDRDKKSRFDHNTYFLLWDERYRPAVVASDLDASTLPDASTVADTSVSGFPYTENTVSEGAVYGKPNTTSLDSSPKGNLKPVGPATLQEGGPAAELLDVLRTEYETVKAGGKQKWEMEARASGFALGDIAAWIASHRAEAFSGANTPILPIRRAIKALLANEERAELRRQIEALPRGLGEPTAAAASDQSDTTIGGFGRAEWELVMSALYELRSDPYRDRLQTPFAAQQRWHAAAAAFPGGLERCAAALRSREGRRAASAMVAAQEQGWLDCAALIDSLARGAWSSGEQEEVSRAS